MNSHHSHILQQSEAQLETFLRFVEASGQALGMADLEGHVFYVNPILCRMLGRDSPEQVYRYDLFDFYHPDTVQRLKQEIIPQVRRDGQWAGELSLIDARGMTTPTIENIFLVQDDKGKPLCFAMVLTDISERIRMEEELKTYRDRLECLVAERTSELEKSNASLRAEIAERKKAQEALKESEERFRSQYHGSPTPTFTWQKRGKDFVLVDFNNAAYRVTGGAVSEFINQSAATLYADQTEVLQNLKECFEKRAVFQREGPSQHFLPGRHTVTTYAFVPHDLVMVHVEDITERKQAEQERTRLTAILESTSDMVAISTPDGRLLYVNEPSRRILGSAEDEDVRTHNLAEVHPKWALDIVLNEGIPGAIAHGVWRGETALLKREGLEIPVSQVIIAHRGASGELEYISTIMRDISERRHREVAHERLLKIMDSTSDLVGAAFPDGQGFYMNAAGRRMAGFGADEDLSKRNMSEVHPAWAWPYVQNVGIQTAIAKGVWEGETVIVNHANGTVIPVSQVIMAHRAANGEIDFISTIIRDISERKRMEEALRESEEKFRTIVDNMQDAFFRCDLNGELVYTTASAARLLGYPSAEEMVGLNVRDFYYHPEEAEKHFGMLQSQGRLAHYEVTLKRRDNAQPVVVSANSQFYRDKDGTIVGIEGVYSDITERKQAEEELRKSEERYRRIVDTANEGMWMLDADLRTTLVNARSAELIGYRVKELIGQKFESFIFEEDLEDHEKRMEARRQGISERYERRLRHRDGHAVITLISATPIFDNELQFQGSFAMITDITERRALEDELIKAQKLDSIGTLAGGLAHDYNNLLTAIMGNVDLAKLYVGKNHQVMAYLAKAQEAALTARDLTRQLITFSKGGYPIVQIIPIQEILRESVRLVLSGSTTKTSWRIADDLPEVKIDANQIRQVIYNIVINAQEAMPQGGTLFIGADTTILGPDNLMPLPEGIYVRLEFRDEGRGISAENLPKIFDPFYTTKDLGNTKGMGLGLSICYSIIKRHGGHIIVDSTFGIGTTVTVYIPRGYA